MARDKVDAAIERAVDDLLSTQRERFKPAGKLDEAEFLREFAKTNALGSADSDVHGLFDALEPSDRDARVLRALEPHR